MDVHVILKPSVCHDVEHLGWYNRVLHSSFCVFYNHAVFVIFVPNAVQESNDISNVGWIPAVAGGGGGSPTVLDSRQSPFNGTLESNDSMNHARQARTRAKKERKEYAKKKYVD